MSPPNAPLLQLTPFSSQVCLLAPVILLLMTLQLAAVNGYPRYNDLIPNGNTVPNPCVNVSGSASETAGNQLWIGVGHLASRGGGGRNQFGVDFANSGRTWNRALCLLDSDGDGRSNGVELGDPLCVWRPGQTPNNVTGITHPGICEPVDSPNCTASINTSISNSSTPVTSLRLSTCAGVASQNSAHPAVVRPRQSETLAERPRTRNQQAAPVPQEPTTRPSLHA